jgi:Peptidase family M23
MALLVVTLFIAQAKGSSDQLSPLVTSALTAEARPFQGTDGRLHIVYELVLTNTNPTAATLTKVDVVDAYHQSTVLASYGDQELVRHLRMTNGAPAETAIIEFNGSRLFLVDFTLGLVNATPGRLMHHIGVLGATSPDPRPVTPVPLSYTVAPIEISRKLPDIGPPLKGKGWVAINGCCDATGIHRSSGLAVNGKLYYAQRFAIDWVLLDGSGRLVHGDPSDVHSYPCYGADVLAVADGTVVDTLDDLNDQTPGHLPDRKTINLENVEGNHVVLDLGDGVFAFYAHLQKGSVAVAVGNRVKRGQVLGKLGNTGNTSGPHLHFHLMEGSSVLGSNGIPYVIDTFALAGQVSAADFAAAPGLEGDWGKGLLQTPSQRHDQLPLDLNVVDFPLGK